MRGFSLVEVMVSVGLGSAIALSSSYITLQAKQSQIREESIFWVQQYRTEVLRTIKNFNSWQATINDPANAASMACVINKTGCRNQAPQPIQKIFFLRADGSKELVFDGSQPNNGFDRNGRTCSTFDPDGNPNCPFRFTFTWSPICISTTLSPNDDCIQPEFEITGNLETASNGKVTPINAKTSQIHLIKSADSNSLADACLSLFGIPKGNPLGSICDMSPQVCNAPEVLVGYEKNKAVCKTVVNQVCPAGQVLKGFDVFGRINCVPGC